MIPLRGIQLLIKFTKISLSVLAFGLVCTTAAIRGLKVCLHILCTLHLSSSNYPVPFFTIYKVLATYNLAPCPFRLINLEHEVAKPITGMLVAKMDDLGFRSQSLDARNDDRSCVMRIVIFARIGTSNIR